jgi:hypothetical protein
VTRVAPLLVSLALAALPSGGRAADAEFQGATARVLPLGRVEIGIFAPVRYGLTDRIELSTHPLWFFVAPNVTAKVAWGQPGGFEIASSHALLYPTPLMRILAREGTGGIVPPDVRYPHIVATAHQLLVTRELDGHMVTARGGLRLAKNLTAWDGPRFWSQVEWHLAWPRMAAWFTGWSVEGGLAAQGPLWRAVGYQLDVGAFLMPGMEGDRAVEWSGLLTLRPRPGLQLRGGAKWSWAEFPYGSRLSVPFPIFDVLWSFDGPGSG